MDNPIRFEHPLNERSRVLLRLEDVFSRFLHYLPSESRQDTQVAISVLMEAVNFFNRTDLKSVLIKELKRNVTTFERLGAHPGLDSDRVANTLQRLEDASTSLHSQLRQIALDVRENEFFKSIMQRSAIPGGTSASDLPHYHLWLEQPAEERAHRLNAWFEELRPVHNSVEVLLFIYRASGVATEEVAENGFFHYTLNATRPAQMVSVELDRELLVFPEVSGDWHRFNIRFRRSDKNSLIPVTCEGKLPFRLSIANI